MQDYNLTNEIKKISGAINNSSPNTELGNINGSVGNLDTAMQGVANAIHGLSIPDPSTAINGVGTAITNKVIPDPNTQLANIVGAIQNIPDTTTALGNIVTAIQALNLSVDTSGLMALDGSHSSNFIVSDCNDDLTGIFFCDNTTANMPLGQIGFANEKLLISIGGPTPGVCNQLFISHDGKVYTRQYILGSWGSWALLKADYISYTDNNNIGETNVQGALDYATGSVQWKYLGAVQGNAQMNYPATWQELWVQCVGSDTTWQNYDFNILKEFINNPNRPANSAFRNGFYVSNADYGDCTIIASATSVYMNSFRVSGNDQTASAVMRVYYR